MITLKKVSVIPIYQISTSIHISPLSDFLSPFLQVRTHIQPIPSNDVSPSLLMCRVCLHLIFPCVIHLLNKSNHLSGKVSFSLDFTHCIPVFFFFKKAYFFRGFRVTEKIVEIVEFPWGLLSPMLTFRISMGCLLLKCTNIDIINQSPCLAQVSLAFI